MSFLELAKKRYSVRKFEDKLVEEDKIKQVLEAGRVAPSAVNFQPVEFIVLQDEELRQKVASTYAADWLKDAPVIIVVTGNHKAAWRRRDGKDHCDIDAAIAIDHITLAAADLGLGTCWVCAFNAMECSTVLRLKANVEPIALIPLGYPADEVDVDRHDEKRKKFEDVVHWNEYRKS